MGITICRPCWRLERQTSPTTNAHQPTARNQNAEAMPPNLLQFVMKGVIIGDQAKLALLEWIFLESPIGR